MVTQLSQRLLVTWSTLALAAGCSQILGLSDYDIDPKLDGAGGQSDSGGGGTPSGGGSKPGAGTSNGGEPASEGGRDGEPAVGGSAGEADTGGAGGSGPVGPFLGCSGKPFDGNDAIIRSCILRVGCQPWA